MTKKILFISNITNKISNFSIPSISAAQENGFEFHMAANFADFEDNEKKYNITIHHIDLERNPFSLKNLKAYRQMKKLLKNEKFDVIHCNTPIGGILGRFAGKSSGVSKVIYSAHGFHFYKGGSLIRNSIYKFSEKFMARFTDALITINKEDYFAAKKFNLRNKGNVYLVPGVGVNTKEYKNISYIKHEKKNSLGLQKDDIVFIAMGDLIPRKNYTVSLQAIAETKNSNIHFLICGKGPEEVTLKLLAEKLGISKQVHFLGFRKDIKELLAISDIFLFTTLQEGLPRSMMEAMSAGLPCIVSKIRGNTDLIKNDIGGYLIEPKDVKGFRNAIEELSVDIVKRKCMGEENLKNIKKYDIENVKKIMLDIYKKEL